MNHEAGSYILRTINHYNLGYFEIDGAILAVIV